MTAEQRAEYWKAEHTAANVEIDRLRARVAELEDVAADAIDSLAAADRRVAELEAELIGDPDFDQEKGCYPPEALDQHNHEALFPPDEESGL